MAGFLKNAISSETLRDRFLDIDKLKAIASTNRIQSMVYFQSQQPAFFEDANDVLPVPDFAKDFKLTLGELFGWLLE